MPGSLSAENLSFAYTGEAIFRQVSFVLGSGDFAAIIGGNGAGKSTLLKLLLGELTPGSGRALLFDEESRQFRNWRRVGYVPQAGFRAGVGFPATAEEIVRGGLQSQIGLFRFPNGEHCRQARLALSWVGLEDQAKCLAGELSGGQLQRVMLARALVGEPELLVLDEPSTGIDRKSAEQLYELLRKLNLERGLTILMVTHDVGRVIPYVSRVFCLEEGSLLELTREEIAHELSHRHTHPELE